MNAGEILSTALEAIARHKLRTALTLLGIVLGSLSITIMASLRDGVVAAVRRGFDDLGYDGVVMVVNRTARDRREQAIFARSRGLQPSDAELLAARLPPVAEVAPAAYDDQVVRAGGQEVRARLIGVTPAYAAVRNRRVAGGRFLSDSDVSTGARVAVLGHRLAARLFGAEDPVGRSVVVGGRPFLVVGFGTRIGNRFVNVGDAFEEMEGLYVPLSTLRRYFTGGDAPLDLIAVRTGAAERLEELGVEVSAALAAAHRGARDFRLENIAEEGLRARRETLRQIRNWTIVLGSIATIALLVGGIGLLSVMWIALGERGHEIGLRRALGATRAHIFLQFLAESMTLGLAGGLLGTALGFALIPVASGFFSEGLSMSPEGLALGPGVAVLLGALYGLYPALRASRTSPIEALRPGL